MAHVAAGTTIAAATLPVYAPAGSAWTSWAPTATPVPASASATTSIETAGGQMTRTTPATSVEAAIPAASSGAVAGVVFIFQLPATITGRIGSIIGADRPRASGHGARQGTARVRARRASGHGARQGTAR